MNKMITAISDEKIIKKIKKNIIVKENNILYREAICEIIKKDKSIDLIIIDTKLPGEINFINLIKKIKNTNKKIEIIIILYYKKKEENIRIELEKMKIENIYYGNIFGINAVIKKLKGNEIQEKSKKTYQINKITIVKKIRKIFKRELEEKDKKKVICLFGKNKIDKEIIELLLIKKIRMDGKKLKKINYNIKLQNINKEIKNIKKRYNRYDYIICNLNSTIYNMKKIKMAEECIKILVIENTKENLIELNKNYDITVNLFVLENLKNNISNYFYKLILKDKFKKIKIISFKSIQRKLKCD